MKKQLLKAERCQSRFVKPNGATVQCSKKAGHVSDMHVNELPGRESFWGDQQAVKA